MHLRATNTPRGTQDDQYITFEPAGAFGFANEYSGLTAEPARYINFAFYCSPTPERARQALKKKSADFTITVHSDQGMPKAPLWRSSGSFSI